jgi:mono/diheme cytochrome c family protein
MPRTRIIPLALFFLSAALSHAGDELGTRAAAVLQKNCTGCHGGAMKMSSLDLRTSDSILKGGERGPAIVPGNPDKSRLWILASGVEQPSMPPGKKLAAADIETLRQWIASGATLDANTSSKEDPAVTLSKLEDRPITDAERNFWAFRKITRPAVPDSGTTSTNPIDHFLDATWKVQGLTPSPEADRRTLIRRVYLDVVGIPPTPVEVNAFLNDTSANAYEKVVDRLLASPQYGERWGSHWLDLVRYSDSGGFEFDRDRNNSWRYRDWVIASFNNDLPYDEFVKMQLAGDEIKPGSVEGLVATGYLRLGPEANMDNEQTRMDELDGILATTGGTMLGMTIGCARCHNHKFDPIPQKDYYRMQAVFFPADREDKPIVTPDEEARYKESLKAFEARLKPLTTELARVEAPFRKKIREQKISELPDYVRTALDTPAAKRTEGQRLNALQVEKTLGVSRGEVEMTLPETEREQACQLREKITLLESRRPHIETAMTVVEKSGATAPESHFLHHGSVGQKGSIMRPGTLTVASNGEWNFPAPPAGAASSMRRKGFAEWITSTSNPLTPRVMANRLWQHHFGEGLVRTPSNFGKTGEPPSHPELLDWLSSELMSNGWRLKPLHRLMLTSRAYRMASDDIAADAKIDGDNRYLWRMPRQRLEGEIIRDSILEVSGSLNRKSGGPGIYPYIDPALWASSSGRSWPGRPDDDPSTFRRSVYIFSKRTIPLPMLEVFDKADSNLSCARRNRSTIAPQALILMNSSFVIFQSKLFAERIELEAGRDLTKQIERAYELALSRKPAPNELAIARNFFEGNPNGLVDFCQTIFNLNEFAYAQ